MEEKAEKHERETMPVQIDPKWYVQHLAALDTDL